MKIKLNRRSQRHYGTALVALWASLTFTTLPVQAQGDALEVPSIHSPLARHSLLLDLDRIGNRLIAVGERGHVLISEDNAVSWKQAHTPVRTTLTASFFVNTDQGWAVGHDGVVLRTQDGGSNWIKLLDGYRANELMLRSARQKVEATKSALEKAPKAQHEALETDLENFTILAEDAESFKNEGPSRPFLDLWFKDASHGIIVGAFGLILRTQDGGDSWAPLLDSLSNPDGYHLNAIRQIGDQLFIAAEAGTLYRSDDWGESWNQLESPYDGSFFGLIGNGQGRIIAYGLRGNTYQSLDFGESWSRIDTGVDSNLYGGTLLHDGSVILVGAAGISVHLDSAGQLINKKQTPHRLPLSTVIASDNNQLLTVGLSGVETATFIGGTQ